ncbi:ABC transporter ATP-binding protein [Lachnospiraceae bacterium MD329]|nr:ABC transporter ATP-binding protein [Lachnospiraceae bacterium MD329]
MKSLKNNLYMLRLIWQACPSGVICEMIHSLIHRFSELFYSVFLLRFIVKAIENGTEFSQVVMLLLMVLVYSASTGIFTALYWHWYRRKIKLKIDEMLLKKMYEKAVECDLSCYENPEFYNKYTRANSEILQRGIKILENCSRMFGIAASAIISTFIIALWEPIVIPIVVVCAIGSIIIDKKRSKLKYKCMVETTPQTRTQDYVNRTVYLQDYAKELRLGNMFFPLLKHFNESVKQAMKITHHYYGIAAWLRVLRELFMSFGTYLVAQGIIIFRYIEQQAYKLSDVVTILNAATTLQMNIYSFTWNMSIFIENGLYVENLKTFFEYKPKITENKNGLVPQNKKHRLTLRNVSFTYEGQTKPTLKNINIDIPEGQKVAFVGHNGAGKSTLVKLIMRLYDVSEGEILLDGVNIKDYRLSDYRHSFGTVFQDFKIFASSIEENVLLHPAQDDNDSNIAYEAVSASGLMDKVNTLEHGMDTQLTREFDDEGTMLSGGEFQKIAVARVFAKQSSIAILDEPSSALDPISEYEMFENMMKACSDKTVMFISHRLSSAVNADVIYLLEQGEIVEQGTHSELMSKNGKYAEMFNMQAKQYKESEVQE